MKPETIRHGPLDMQVCVPQNFTDRKILDFANTDNLCGTKHGWFIRKEGHEFLRGMPERVPCAERKTCVHVMLDA